jgi:rRNA maturation RNase YbeY
MKRKTNPFPEPPTKTSPRGFCTVVRSGTRGRIPQLPYDELRRAILGSHYNLTIAFVSEARSTELHIQWKHQDGPANILSFPYSDTEGEIILHLPTVYAKSAEFDHTPKQHLLFLIIHGCLHLLGHTHGSPMEQLERHWMKEFWK